MFQKISVSKFLMPQRGISRFSVEVFFVSHYRKTSLENLSCSAKFLVSKNFMDKRGGMEGV